MPRSMVVRFTPTPPGAAGVPEQPPAEPPSPPPMAPAPRSRWSKRQRLGLGVVLALVLVLAALEAGARLGYAYREELDRYFGPRGEELAALLEPYTQVDPTQPDLWRLRPNTVWTLGELILAERDRGDLQGARSLTELSTQYGIAPGTALFRVNAQGFRGPDLAPLGTRTRILALGDEITFGTHLDRYTYPRVLESALSWAGYQVEVINGGVPGYRARHILDRIDDYQALRPALTLLYLGWGSIYRDHDRPRRSFSYGVGLLADVFEWLDPRIAIERAHGSTLRPEDLDTSASALRPYKGYEPGFIADLERIIDAMTAVGSRVVLLTLPGLFLLDEAPSARGLRIAHLPAGLHNPYALAMVTQRTNEALRQLAERRHPEVLLVDLERWSRRAWHPRDRYFTDSVHLSAEGQGHVGLVLVQALTPLLVAEGRRARPGPSLAR